ncbi:glucose-6-phosphate dehydrogenase [Hoyosella rhizosphaerae]|uniref:Glucose-6-phosphate 1-dehydrogenase n=1 Tax=Hoyosella rhizosphaerae TaxID=1755582 RepID=A0A916U7G0_9ACTN|nr:glucose-6-phosphate dehydrogenase [Hoyosella rhizosphaerae]MBN4927672.1 glucose-6-phosphate dehydrogenase [Hoyosella rhizosphaerae]GGC62608.1 glucose-6-phosphate 1-dehydrogenase [Hoyosella rhizosphaerae]
MNTRTLLILGANGDLTHRLLLPGLGRLIAADPELDIALIGAGRTELSDQTWFDRASKAMLHEVDEADSAARQRIKAVAEASRYLTANVTTSRDLAAVLAQCPTSPAVYFALPPAVTIEACTALRDVDLPAGIVLALEKPFGTSVATAEELNALLTSLVPEPQVYRVDHFLGKSTVLNLLGLRFANRIFEPIWNADSVESVMIYYDEELGLEQRAGYYDKAGALVDMIQSHLLLVMALVAMETPSSLHPDDLRGAMAQVLRAARPWQGDAATAGRRARYATGSINGRTLPNYVDEPGVDPQRGTETLAEVKIGIENWRWAGVPFTLRSGKAVGNARKEIIITFKNVPHLITGLTGCASPPRLRVVLDPDRLHLDLNINGAGDPFNLEQVTMSAEFGKGALSPYGEVLSGILDGDPILSIRGDVAEQCWRIVEPVQQAWGANTTPLEDYEAGTPGPKSWNL